VPVGHAAGPPTPKLKLQKKSNDLPACKATRKKLTGPQRRRLENLCRYGPQGVAGWEARREYLDLATYTLESPGVDVDAVLDALGEARVDQLNALIRAQNLDHRRELHAAIVLFKKALRRARRRLLPLLGPDPGPYAGPDRSRRGGPSQVGRVRNAIQALEESPLLDPESPAFAGRLRRGRRGHQPEPWLAKVRQRLSGAGVPKEKQDELLRLTGLRRAR
jgi:hypothetical protein